MFKLKLAFIVTVALLMTGPVFGIGRRATAQRSCGTCYPNYYQSYSAPYYQPTYYQPTYYPAQKVVAQEIAVAPLLVTVPVDYHAVPIQAYGVNHYWSVQESYQQKNMLREIIREELRNAVSGQQPLQQTPMVQQQQPAMSNGQPQYVQQQSQAGQQRKVTDLGVDYDTPAQIADPVVADMRKYCYSCHGAANKEMSGGLRLLYQVDANTFKLAKQTTERKGYIYARMSLPDMPPSAKSNPALGVPQNRLLLWYNWVQAR